LRQEPSGLQTRSTGTAFDFLAGGGEMGALIAAHDWAATPLGPADRWPHSLQTVVRVMLTSRFAMWMAWGPDLIFFCNDAYRPTLGVKQPWALGASARHVWAEVWSDAGPRIQSVLETGRATWDEGLLLLLERSGYPEETYHTFSYSPVPDDRGAIAGMLCVVTEETDRVLSGRRVGSLQRIASGLADSITYAEVQAAIRRDLGANPHDLPFTLVYLFDEAGETAELVCSTGIADGHAAAPASIRLDDGDPAWPAAELRAGRPSLTVSDFAGRFGTMPSGAWDRPPEEAIVVPIARAGQDAPAGFLVVGANPYRRLDAGYSSYIVLVAGQIASAFAGARAYEEERRRAEALAELDRSKTLFFSNVSHEFRTPLTLMMGPLEEALADQPERLADHRRDLQVAHRNALRLLKLVNTLLDFSRIEAGRIQARYQPTDIAALTTDLASNFRSAMERAGLDFVIDAPPLPEPVYLDRDMWEKVVLNLLSNAFKFTLTGRVGVTVRASADGRGAEVEVRDTGTGIPAEELPKLFERFHRVEGAAGRTFEGSGIGLALVQELVRLHGGGITVRSTVGEGSAFTVFVPFGCAHLTADRVVSEAAAPATSVRAQAYVEEALRWLPDGAGDLVDALDHAAVPAEEAGGAPSTGAPAGHRRILLADDNADMRDYVRRLLVDQGYQVEAVPDGEAALAAARARRPDLVLSDVMMPRLDGFGLLKAIRADEALDGVPVILLSARAGEEARIEGREAGADDYLAKPFATRELLARVRSNLEMAAARNQINQALREEARILETLNRVGSAVAAELDLERSVQVVTDAGRELSGAAFGAFFYNVADEKGEAYTLYTISGVPREAFSSFPMPRKTAIFQPTFDGTGVMRSDDITGDPRYGRNEPHHGMPKGHLPVRSYLAVPVTSRTGAAIGGLFFGHPEPGVFTERSERLVVGLASQAAIAIDNGQLYRAAQTEIAQRRSTEAALRASEEGLERLNEDLEARVVERTEELRLAHEQLRQAQKMETIGQLAGGVAHDFNNLLTIIVGNLETLQRRLGGGADPATLRRSAENAFRGAKRAAALTQSLLAFSRRQPLDPKPLDVNKIVAGMSDMLQRTLGEQISVQTVLGGGIWRSFADPNQLESAVLNLAVNARDAMPGGGRLTIETANVHLDEAYSAMQAEVAPGQYAVIAVSDSGSGMSKDVMARAFDPFFTTKDTGQGTGLGLSQVYGFVKQSGGHVKLYSEPGQGTTVKVYLPRLFTGGREEEQEQAPGPAPRSLGTETILVVEDDDDVRLHSTEILRELGYSVLEAPNGAAGLAILDRHPEVRLLFTDVGLPGGMNGRQLADAARARFPKLRVLFTTGYAKNAIVHDGRLDPGVQLVTKPFVYDVLAAKIRDMLDLDDGPKQILVVEDEPLVRMVTVDELLDLGFRVEEAGNATEALNKVRMAGGAIDAVIVDVGLPDRKGDDLARELRSMYVHLPVVIASGYGADAFRGAFAGDPLVRFVGKPYETPMLTAALGELGVTPPSKS